MTASLKGPAEQQGNQGQRQSDGYHTPGITQYIPIAAGPPRLEQYVPAVPVRVLPPSLSLRVHTAFLTVLLSAGAQRPPSRSRSSSSQHSRAVSRKSQPYTF